MNREQKEMIMRSVVQSFCINGRMFTSVEVANHLKRLGVWVRNKHVGEYLRENVHSISFEYGINYAKTNINVDGSGVNDGSNYIVCICHHPIKLDPGKYRSRDLKAITPDEFEARHGVYPYSKDDTIPPILTKGETLMKTKDVEKAKAQFSFVVD